MADYSGFIALAYRLINQKGGSATLRTFTKLPAANPDQPWKVPDSTYLDTPITAVFLPFDSASAESFQFAPGSEVQEGDEMVLVAGAAVVEEPSAGSLLIKGSETLTVISGKRYAPDGTSLILFVLHARS